MNTLRNKVQLIGRLGQNPELRTFDSGKSMAKFSIATDDSYRDSTGKQITETQWHNVVVWGSLAKLAEKYLVKGSEVAIEGRLTHRAFEDKEGKKSYYTEVVVNDMVFMRNTNAGEEQ
jgi:single-strand DNA-binding protein